MVNYSIALCYSVYKSVQCTVKKLKTASEVASTLVLKYGTNNKKHFTVNLHI